jgi:hypothetical protein
MCTVSFIPSGTNYFFTSSRDEQADRPMAVQPEQYVLNGYQILFPKDSKAGGSWIAVNEMGHVAVLLNGAVKAHQPEPPYRKSRGLVLIDLISSSSPVDSFEESDFSGIEPFTVILFENQQLWSGKWDGRMKWLESLNSLTPQIWSSVTLYDPVAVLKRENWFKDWFGRRAYPGTLDIIRFHQKGGAGDLENGILMNRNDRLFTNSISSIRLSPNSASFRYFDLRNGQQAERMLRIQKTIPVKA